jgi:hypothetical protein
MEEINERGNGIVEHVVRGLTEALDEASGD